VAAVEIMIVDDFKEWRTQLHRFLELLAGFYVVAEAANGLEAVDKAARFLPDIVLLDIGMPLLNGIEACPTNSEGVSRVRNHFPDRKFVERCKGRVLSSRRRRLRS